MHKGVSFEHNGEKSHWRKKSSSGLRNGQAAKIDADRRFGGK